MNFVDEICMKRLMQAWVYPKDIIYNCKLCTMRLIVVASTVCEITACQRTFSGQKCFLSGHTDICMDKMSGQSLNQKLLEIDNYIHNYKSFSTMSRQFYPCPWKLCHGPDSVSTHFSKVISHTASKLMQNSAFVDTLLLKITAYMILCVEPCT